MDGRQSGEGADSYLVRFWGDCFGDPTVPYTHVDPIATPHAAEEWIAPIPLLKSAMDLCRTVKWNDGRE